MFIELYLIPKDLAAAFHPALVLTDIISHLGINFSELRHGPPKSGVVPTHKSRSASKVPGKTGISVSPGPTVDLRAVILVIPVIAYIHFSWPRR